MPKLCDDKKTCCGCAACRAVCPTGAIKMASDGVFFYPAVDEAKCVDCKKCERVCAFKKEKQTAPTAKAAFAVVNNDEVRRLSSSGGVFTALSDAVLKTGGAVYGVSYDTAMRAVYTRADDQKGRNAMRGSKYVQADMTDVYSQIKADLAAGKRVLFSGTPCAVAAVKAVIGNNENLTTVDIICHGVPSPVLWADFVALLGKAYGSPVTDYHFRNKDVAWRRYSPLVTLRNGKTVGENDLTGSFIEAFRYELTLRPSCESCPYTSMHRQGDLTIGDFWGVEKQRPDLNDDRGVSAVLVNTGRGQALLNEAAPAVTLTEVLPGQIEAGQVNLKRPSVRSAEADVFANIWKTEGVEAALKKYTRVGVKRRLKDAVKKAIGKA